MSEFNVREGFLKPNISVLFLCDRKACLECSGDICHHTTTLAHAVNGHVYLYDPIKFLNENCCTYISSDKDRIIFEEEEN